VGAHFAELVALAALVLTFAAEALHARRVRRVARLAFGPGKSPAAWVGVAPWLRAAAFGALGWGLATLLVLEPRKFSTEGGAPPPPDEVRHILLVLDVSPSMSLEDAGPEKKLRRSHRAREVLESFFRRVPLERNLISIIAVYNGAKAVVEDTSDFEVVRNILTDLPMTHAFRSGKTKLFDGIEEAARLAKDWNPKSATLVLVTDGDTVPSTGMPKLPVSIGDVLVVGIGDPTTGKFIEGRQSRQDVSTLRQVAARLGGLYWNGNEHHLASADISALTAAAEPSAFEGFSRREYALLACLLGAGALALLPLLLQRFGTSFRPGQLVSATAGRRVPRPRLALRSMAGVESTRVSG
jgi:Ca-activated chloride channel family protein